MRRESPALRGSFILPASIGGLYGQGMVVRYIRSVEHHVGVWHEGTGSIVPNMRHGRIVRVTLKAPDGGFGQTILYIVAEEDREKSMGIIEAKVPPGTSVEGLGQVTSGLLATLELVPGEFVRI